MAQTLSQDNSINPPTLCVRDIFGVLRIRGTWYSLIAHGTKTAEIRKTGPQSPPKLSQRKWIGFLQNRSKHLRALAFVGPTRDISMKQLSKMQDQHRATDDELNAYANGKYKRLRFIPIVKFVVLEQPVSFVPKNTFACWFPLTSDEFLAKCTNVNGDEEIQCKSWGNLILKRTHEEVSLYVTPFTVGGDEYECDMSLSMGVPEVSFSFDWIDGVAKLKNLSNWSVKVDETWIRPQEKCDLKERSRIQLTYMNVLHFELTSNKDEELIGFDTSFRKKTRLGSGIRRRSESVMSDTVSDRSTESRKRRQHFNIENIPPRKQPYRKATRDAIYLDMHAVIDSDEDLFGLAESDHKDSDSDFEV